MTLILVSLEHWYPWFVLETTGEAHQLFFCLIDCQYMIFHCPLVDAAHISPPVQFVWPTCLFLSYALLNVIICSTIQPFYFHPPSDGLVYPSCKFHVVIWVSYPLNHLFLAVSLSSCQPPLPPPVLLTSDNHPGSAPILQLAASSFQNPGAPPHETKSKFHWSSGDNSQL